MSFRYLATVLMTLSPSASAAAEDAAFCPRECPDGECAQDPNVAACITFDEAADLAQLPGSGVFELRARTEGTQSLPGTYAENANAICSGNVCYLREDGVATVYFAANQVVFERWSGCSDSTGTGVRIGPLSESVECVAHAAPADVQPSTYY